MTGKIPAAVLGIGAGAAIFYGCESTIDRDIPQANFYVNNVNECYDQLTAEKPVPATLDAECYQYEGYKIPVTAGGNENTVRTLTFKLIDPATFAQVHLTRAGQQDAQRQKEFLTEDNTGEILAILAGVAGGLAVYAASQKPVAKVLTRRAEKAARKAAKQAPPASGHADLDERVGATSVRRGFHHVTD